MASPSAEPARDGQSARPAGPVPAGTVAPAAPPAPSRAPAQGGWVLPALALLLAAPADLLARAWLRLDPGTAPPEAVLVGATVALGLLAFSLAAGVALEPAQAPGWWRPVVAGALAATTALVTVATPHRLPLGAVPVAAILALTARAAETVGCHLSPAVRVSGEYPADAGQWAAGAPETRRIVLETWIVCALAAAAARGWLVTADLAAVAAGGLLLIAGSKLAGLHHLSTAEGFTWDAADLAVAWRWAAGAAAVALGLGLAVPGLPALLPRGVPWLFRLLLHHMRAAAPPPAIPAQNVPGPPAASPGSGFAPAVQGSLGISPGVRSAGIFAYLLMELLRLLPVILAAGVALAVGAILLIMYIRTYGGDWRLAARRLWEGLLRALAFWRWLGLRWSTGEARLAPAPPRAAAEAPAGGEAEPPWRLLDPRLAVRASYRRFLQRAAGAGHPRPAGQSPAGYERAMAPVLPDAAPEAGALTRAYEEARYSHHPIPPARVHPVRAALQKVLQALSRTRGT